MSDSRNAGRDGPDDAELFAAIRRDRWSGLPGHEGLVMVERRRHARKAVASTVDPFEAWYRLVGLRGEGGPTVEGRWFHLRRGSIARVERHVVRRMQAAAVRVALCPSPGVPKAPCVAHPLSVADAIAFGSFGPLLRDIEARARSAADAFDAIGQPTHALALVAKRPQGRAIVWRTRAGEGRAAPPRAAVLLASKVLEQLGDGRGWHTAHLGPLGEAVPANHPSEWSRTRVAALGALAWRAAVERGLRVTPTGAECGPRFFVMPDVVGRAYADLADPFGPLCRLGALGVEVAAVSPEALTLEAWSDAPADAVSAQLVG